MEDITSQIAGLNSYEEPQVIAKAKEILAWIHQHYLQLLETQGVNIVAIQQAFAAIIPGFQPMLLGFPKLMSALQFLCTGTPLCVARTSQDVLLLYLRTAVPEKDTQLPDLEPLHLHSETSYRAFLTSKQIHFQLPSQDILATLLDRVIEIAPLAMPYPELLDHLGDTKDSQILIRRLFQTGLLTGDIEGKQLSETSLTLETSMTSTAIRSHLRQTIRDKLSPYLTHVKDEILEELVPSIASPPLPAETLGYNEVTSTGGLSSADANAFEAPQPTLFPEREIPMYTLYGIKNCSTVKKALAHLDAQGIAYTFVDYKKQPPTLADLERWRAGFGELPVNKAGTTYRTLKADYEAADAAQQAALLVANPSAIKRPILEGPNVLLKGFNPDEWAL
jgi:Spx/MgsR family transcriptional regulator